MRLGCLADAQPGLTQHRRDHGLRRALAVSSADEYPAQAKVRVTHAAQESARPPEAESDAESSPRSQARQNGLIPGIGFFSGQHQETLGQRSQD